MSKVKIVRSTTPSGFTYAIPDWDAYLVARKLRSLEAPLVRFTYSIAFETNRSFESLHGSFDRQVPTLFELPSDACEIVAA